MCRPFYIKEGPTLLHDQQTGKKKVSKEGRCIHCDKPSTHVSLGIRFCTECVQAMKKR